jgi:ABC-type transport system involved in multi-copper enzyme maturation permease subunit
MLAGLALAVPAGLIGAIVVEDETSNGVFVFFLVIMIGMLAAGFVAGSKRPDTPFIHGAAAAAATYVVAQGITLIVRAATGSELRSPVVYVFNLLLMASIGVVGALVAERRNARVQS